MKRLFVLLFVALFTLTGCTYENSNGRYIPFNHPTSDGIARFSILDTKTGTVWFWSNTLSQYVSYPPPPVK